jgi:hypothetical protein
VIQANQLSFGLDNQLGHLDANVHIPLIPGAKPISLTPFPSSPNKQEIIDKQMDRWIQLGMIELSKSPWAAPAFIVYQNGKVRMVVDCRKLNKITIFLFQNKRTFLSLGQISMAIYIRHTCRIYPTGGRP